MEEVKCKECEKVISVVEARENCGYCEECMNQMWLYYEELENERLDNLHFNDECRNNYFEDVVGWRK